MTLKYFVKLSYTLAKAEFKVKNEGKYLGILWYILNPLLVFMLLLFIFSKNIGTNIENYTLYLLLGIIMANIFQQITIDSTKILSSYKGIIKSIKFPRQALVAAAVLKTLFTHVFELIIFILILIIMGKLTLTIIFYPIIILFFMMLIFGISLILSSLNVFFTDLDNIWAFLSKLIWFATPIFYTISNNSKLFIINLLNPLYYFITITREIIIYNSLPEMWLFTGALLHTLIFLALGILIFKKLDKKFAEVIR
ncbi:MAG: ABC transporter permease [archaeon]